MSTFAALVTKPFDRLLDIQAALPFLQNHFTPASRRMPSSKALASHRPQLYAHQTLDHHGRFSARFFRSPSDTFVASLKSLEAPTRSALPFQNTNGNAARDVGLKRARHAAQTA